jgi:hypothetical protein
VEFFNMRDERNRPGQYDPEEDDNPYHLPPNDGEYTAVGGSEHTEFADDDYPDDTDLPFRLPKVNSDEDTDDIDVVQPDAASPHGSHNMPTMPIFREPGVPDYKQTLPGSGGLDPNPDFANTQFGQTSRHQPVQPPPQQDYQQYQRPAQPVYPAPQQTMPPMPPAQGNGTAQGKRVLPRRRTRKGFLGMPIGCLWIFLGTLVTFCGGRSCCLAWPIPVSMGWCRSASQVSTNTTTSRVRLSMTGTAASFTKCLAKAGAPMSSTAISRNR